MKINKYEIPEVTVIALSEDIITSSDAKGETPVVDMDKEFDW